MKRIMVGVAAVLFSGAVIASPLGDSKKENASVAKEVKIGSDYYKIVVDDDIDLALVESSAKDMSILAKGNTHQDVNWKIKEGVLYLSSNAHSLKDKVKITLAVNKLRQLVVNGASAVHSIGYLQSPGISVTINGDCKVTIQNRGAIELKRTPDTDMEVTNAIGAVYVRNN
ncbi:MAG: DUF2807 domain-containing protein [Chitinophagales bacterium]|nr:DUF2807 domain-containing protein [Chitinophagales bacterium]